MKKKTYVLMISEHFPKYHPRAGEPTNFEDKIRSGEKIHTIRPNYKEWKRKEKEINEGRAILSIRKWSGLAYRSKHKELLQLEKIGVEPIELLYFDSDKTDTPLLDLFANEGLSGEDFKAWFEGSLKKLQALIHFTDFRY